MSIAMLPACAYQCAAYCRASKATGARALAADTLALITFVAADDFELTRTIMLTLEGLQSAGEPS